MKKIKDNRRGSTLVEVIVTFALIGMFLLGSNNCSFCCNECVLQDGIFIKGNCSQ